MNIGEYKMAIAIFTEPEVTNCFSKIALVIIRENKTKTKICDSETSTNLAAILKTESPHCYNHLTVIKARKNEVLDKSARAIFDSYQCNFTNFQQYLNLSHKRYLSLSVFIKQR